MQGVLATLTGRQNAQEQAGAPTPGASVVSAQHFGQMCFAVYSQIALDRIFDDYPIAIRMFLVQKVSLVTAFICVVCIVQKGREVIDHRVCRSTRCLKTMSWTIG